jgi:hypothetical protein
MESKKSKTKTNMSIKGEGGAEEHPNYKTDNKRKEFFRRKAVKIGTKTFVQPEKTAIPGSWSWLLVAETNF